MANDRPGLPARRPSPLDDEYAMPDVSVRGPRHSVSGRGRVPRQDLPQLRSLANSRAVVDGTANTLNRTTGGRDAYWGSVMRRNDVDAEHGAVEYYRTRDFPLSGEDTTARYGITADVFARRNQDRTQVRSSTIETTDGASRPGRGAVRREKITVAEQSATATGVTAVCTEASSSGDVVAAPPRKKQRKRANYLRHSQRCTIIERIAGGEQQAALAREYNVTRAAICHIQKNRFEILAREYDDEESEGEDENSVDSPRVNPRVTEIRGSSVLLRLTALRDLRTTPPVFHQTACRLMMMLVEEAVALFGTRPVERVSGGGHVYSGLEREHHFCGVSLNDAIPFAASFQQVEDDAPVGSIDVEERGEGGHAPARDWEIVHMDVPESIVAHKILLLGFCCGTGGEECKAVEVLCSLGIAESDISLVMIQCSSAGIAAIGNRFPSVRIITAAVDDQVTPGTDVIFPGLSTFASHYRSLVTHVLANEKEEEEEEEKKKRRF